jgi:predicted RNA-binding protein YlxR (DUF448 family)
MKTPIRTCAGCGAKRAKSEMIRVGLDKDGEPGVTGPGKHAGRGSYLCKNVTCVDSAREKKALSRALHRDIPAAIYDKLEREIEDGQKVTSG